MIGPMLKYPVNVAGTKLSPMDQLEGVYVDHPNGGSSDWKATFDYGKHLFQYAGSTEKSVTWHGSFVLDLHNEWAEIYQRRQDIWYVELIIRSTNVLWTSSVQDWVDYGVDVDTPNGPRRLLAKKKWFPPLQF